MMPFGTITKSSDDLWEMLAFVLSQYSGDPATNSEMPYLSGLRLA